MSQIVHKGHEFDVMTDGSGVAAALKMSGAVISVGCGNASKPWVKVIPSRRGYTPKVPAKVLKAAEALVREVIAMQSPEWHAQNRAMYGE